MSLTGRGVQTWAAPLALIIFCAAAMTWDLFDGRGRRQGYVRQSPGGRVDVFDAQTGERVGVIREGPGRSMDAFNERSERLGWGRVNSGGSVELFRPDGQRLGTVTPDGKVLRLERSQR